MRIRDPVSNTLGNTVEIDLFDGSEHVGFDPVGGCHCGELGGVGGHSRSVDGEVLDGENEGAGGGGGGCGCSNAVFEDDVEVPGGVNHGAVDHWLVFAR